MSRSCSRCGESFSTVPGPRKLCFSCSPPEQPGQKDRRRDLYRQRHVANLAKACPRCGTAVGLELVRDLHQSPRTRVLCQECRDGRGWCPDCGCKVLVAKGAPVPPRCDSCRTADERARYMLKNASRRRVVMSGSAGRRDVRNLLALATRCPLCDVQMVENGMVPEGKTIDHIVPVSRGGTHSVANLRVICRKCNTIRGASMRGVGQITIEMVANVGESALQRREREREELRCERDRLREFRRCDLSRRRAGRVWLQENTKARRRPSAVDPRLVECMVSWGWGYKRIGRFFGVDRTVARAQVRRIRAAA